MSDPIRLNLIVGWSCMAAGAISGAVIGLFFHRDGWLGGYASFTRRMIRLGHIAFFGLGIVNILFALSVQSLSVAPLYGRFAATGFAIGAATMPVCCFLSAWRPAFRHLFPIPVISVLGGVGGLLGGWWLR